MPRSILLLAALTIVSLTLAGQAQNTPNVFDDVPDVFAKDDKGNDIFKKEIPTPVGQPSVEIAAIQLDPEDIQDGETRTYTRRYLRAVNSSKERITVFLQYLSEVGGQAAWLPSSPQEGNALSYVLEPNQELKLDHLLRYVASSRVRLWAHSDYWVWENYKNKDLSLIDEPGGRYQGTTMGTYYYYFMGAEFPDIGKGDVVPVDPNPPVPAPVPFIPIPAPIDNNLVIIPDFPPEPNIVIVREADLGVVDFRVDPNGTFQGTISNFGPNRYLGGRRWFVMQSGPGGKMFTVKSGRIDALFPTRQQHVFGNAQNLGRGASLVFAISKGDNNPGNDYSGVILVTPSKADLAVSSLRLVGNQVVATVVNNGPNAYDGKRTYNLSDTLGLVNAKRGFVPPLASGDSTTVTLDVPPGGVGTRNLFAMRISPGDDQPLNDTRIRSFTPKVNAPDLAAVGVRVENSRLIGIIANLGPGDFTQGQRTYTLTHSMPLPGGQPQVTTDTQAIPNLTDGDRKEVSIAINPNNLRVQGTLRLTLSAGDGQPGNDQTAQNFTPAPTAPGDLAVSNLTLTGNTLTGVIRNVGFTPYKSGTRQYFLGVVPKKGGPRIGLSQVIDSLNVGAQTIVAFQVPQANIAGPFILQLQNDAADGNRQNDTIFFTPGGTPPNPNPGKGDLAVANLSLSGSTLSGVIRNIGGVPFTGQRQYFLGMRPAQKGAARQGKTANVPNLPAGAETAVSVQVPQGSLAGPFMLQLQPDLANDGNRQNDTTFFTPGGTPPPPPGKGLDLAVSDLKLSGVFLSAKIRNVGSVPFTGQRSFFLGVDRKNLGDPKVGNEQNIPNIPVGGEITPLFNVPQANLGGPFVIVLQNAADDVNPANDKLTFTPNLPVPKTPDLAISSFSISEEHSITFKIVNNGPGRYAGGSTYTLSNDKIPAGQAVGADPIPALDEGQSFSPRGVISFANLFKNLTPGTPVRFTLKLDHQDAVPGNNTALTTGFAGKKAPDVVNNTPDLEAKVLEYDPKARSLRYMIRNNGPGKYDGGSTFTLIGDRVGTVAQGTLPAMLPGQSFSKENVDVSAKVDPESSGAVIIFTLKVNHQDGNQANNTAVVRATGGTDAANITKIDLEPEVDSDPEGKNIKIAIRNNGPGAYTNGGGYQLSASGINDLIDEGKVPSLPQFQSFIRDRINISNRLAALPAGTKVTLTLRVVGNDAKPGNNVSTKVIVVGGKTPPMGQPDLEVRAVLDPRFGKLVGAITNKGPGKYAGGSTYAISEDGVGVHERKEIPPLAENATFPVSLDIRSQVAKATRLNTPVIIRVELNHKDAQPGNNTDKVTLLPKQPDLEIAGVQTSSGKLTFRVKNRGPGNYAGGSSYTVTGHGIGIVVGGAIPAVAENAETVINADLSKAPAGTNVKGNLQLNHKDDNQGNNLAIVTILVEKGGGQPAQKASLAITSLQRQGGRVTGTVQNIGNADVAGNAGTVVFIINRGGMGSQVGGPQIIQNLKAGQSQTFFIGDPGPGLVEMRVNSTHASPTSGSRKVP